MQPSQAGRSFLTLESDILELADRCVKCGLCLPHCPTYQYSQDENESPRGRIALLQGLAAGQLDASGTLRQHLDRCLDCRACERVCPAEVRYEKLLDLGKVLAGPPPRPSLLKLPARAGRMRWLNRLLRFYQRSGLQWLLRHGGLPARSKWRYYDSLLPRLRAEKNFARHYPADEAHQRVALFTGCLASTLEQQTVEAAIALLNRLGVTVDILPAQTCCGAIAMHNGDPGQARQLARQNITAFATAAHDAILYLATGCGAQLQNYADLPWPDPAQQQQATEFTDRLQEVTAYLAQLEWPARLPLSALDRRIAVHEPCSQKNALRQPEHSTTLLQRIPQARVYALAENARCCGAAGSYMLRQPERARAFRRDKLAVIEQSDADYVVTTNPGCSLFLNAALQGVEVVHPVLLLEAVTRGE